jgi:hypothetical protein
MHLVSSLHWLLTALQQALYRSKHVDNTRNCIARAKLNRINDSLCLLSMTVGYADSVHGDLHHYHLDAAHKSS